jgi:hypothetical protein
MNRQGLWVWLLLLGLLVLLGPGKAAHLLLDLLGGITLTVLLLPLLAAGAAFLGWQMLRSRLHTCPNCGLTSLGVERCPACGTSLQDGDPGDGPPVGVARGPDAPPLFDARDVTIDVVARSVDTPADD